jgi:hypothetical protein
MDGNITYVYRILVGKHERKRPLGMPLQRWENIIQMDLKEIKHEVVTCIHHHLERKWWL